jgi:hypothetical protein
VPTAALRRVAAVASALALGVAGTLVAAPAYAAPSTAPSPISPTDGTVVADSTPELRWGPATSAQPSTLRYLTEIENASGQWVRGSLLIFDDDWSPLVPLPDGTYTWRVRGYDTPSLWEISSPGPWSQKQTFTVDTIAPDVVLTAPTSGLFGASGVTVTGTVADANLDRVELRDNGDLIATDNSGSSTYSFAHAPATGSHLLTVTAYDKAGNSDAGSTASVSVVIDADAPSLAIASPSNGAYVRPGVAIDFRASAADANRYSWNARLDGNGITGGYGHLVSGTTNYQTSVDTSAWADGSSHEFLFTARDELDQKSTVTATVIADASRPVVTFATPARESAVRGVMSVSGTATDTGSGVSSFKLEVREVNQNGNCGAFIGDGYTVPVGAGGAWSLDIDTATYGDGRFCFTALAADAVGNTNGGGSSLKWVEFDNTAPIGTLSPVFPTGFTLAADRFQWSPLTDPNGVTYEVALGNHPNVDANGLMSSGLELLGSTDQTSLPHAHVTGPAFWQVRAVDSLGNATAWTAPRGFQVVGVPSVVFPTPGLEFSADTLTAQWTPSFGVGGVARYEVEYGFDRDHDGILTPETRSAPGHTAWPAGIQSRIQSFSSGYEGPMTIRVRAVYNIALGGSVYGPWSEPAVSYIRDTAKPVVSILAPAADAVVKSDAALPVTVTGTDNAGVSRLVANLYEADGTSFLAAIGSTAPNGALGQSATRTWDIPAGLAEGTYVIRASATDAAGKTTATSQSFTVDRTRPTVTIETPTNGALLAGGDVTVTVTGLDPNGLRTIVANLYDATGKMVKAIGQADVTGTTSTTQTWTIPASAFTADGTFTIRAGAFDLAGNNRTVSAGFTRDTTAPAAPQPFNPRNGTMQANDAPTLVWLPVADASSYEVRTSTSPGRTPNQNDGELDGSSAVTHPATSATSLPLAGLGQGWLWWQVRATDAAGNVGPWSNIWATGVDTVAPVVTLASPANGATVATGTFELTWTGESGAAYEVRSSTDSATDPTTGQLLGTVGGGTDTTSATRYPLAGVPEGTYYWQVRATDAVGNVGSWTAPFAVAVELPQLPTQAVTPPAAPAAGAAAGAAMGTGGATDDVDLTTFALTADGPDAAEGDGAPRSGDGADAEPEAASNVQPAAGIDPVLLGIVGAILALLALLVVLFMRSRRRDSEA